MGESATVPTELLLPPRHATPFRVDIPEESLVDLQRRLRAFAAAKEPADADWRYGTPTAYMQELLRYWHEGYDWRAWETHLNRHTQYLVPVHLGDGSTLRIHVTIEMGSNPSLPPVVLTHGWPSLPFEFDAVIDRIAHPERSGGSAANGATVIAPSLPGFGFSDAPSRPMHAREIARCWHQLMTVGFDCQRFFAHGGDWGAVVSTWLAVDFPQVLTGLHLSMLGLRPAIDPALPLIAEERQWVKDIQARLALDGGYREQQATRPTTLAIGLADSPAFVAAWIIDKYHGWCGAEKTDPPRLDRDAMLTLASIYWFSGSLPTANWIYFAERRDAHQLDKGQRCDVPTYCSFFGQGFFPPPPTHWIERGHALRFREDFEDGGHFPALLKPLEFVRSLQACHALAHGTV